MRRNRLLYAGWFTNLPRFQGARFDHVRVESSCCCFPSELVKFVRPWELLSFDPRHVTRCPPIGKRIWVGMYYNPDWCNDWLRIVQQRTDRLWSYTVLHCVAKVLILLKTRLIIAVIHTTFWNKNQGLKGIRTHDLCDTSAVQLSYQANWELAKL